ncbi:MAG: hypothetical protein EOO68_31345, partial [Moraxellaceae bacterium]
MQSKLSGRPLQQNLLSRQISADIGLDLAMQQSTAWVQCAAWLLLAGMLSATAQAASSSSSVIGANSVNSLNSATTDTTATANTNSLSIVNADSASPASQPSVSQPSTSAPKRSFRQQIKQHVNALRYGEPTDNTINLTELSQYDSIIREVAALPTIQVQAVANQNGQYGTQNNVQNTTQNSPDMTSLDLIRAVQLAVNRHPSIAQTLSELAQGYSQVDVAKAGYWPQVQAGVSTGRIGTSESGRQLLSVNATQMLYDFGKVSSRVDVARATVDRQKAVVLQQIDDIARQTAEAVINVRRYQELQAIAEQQVRGVARILEITQLRA